MTDRQTGQKQYVFPVVPEICRGQVHGPQKERRRIRIRIRIIIIKIIIRNGAKTISFPNFVWET